MSTFIQEFSILFITIVVVSFLVKLIRQPIIIGYVLSGLFFSFMIKEGGYSSEQIVIFSELGITFLLFLIGMEFDFKNLKYLSKDLFFATTIQSIVFFLVAFVVVFLFGFSTKESIYLAVLFMFSSTLLVAKWIEDKKETTTLHGKIVLGILIIQDLFAIMILTVLSVAYEQSITKIILVPVGGIVLLLIAFVFAKYILNSLLKIAVRYPELLFIFGLGICFFFVWISPLLGYSATIGAFIAGVTLANTDYKSDIHSRLKPLIIFFNMLFFVGLGFQINPSISLNIILLIIVLCVLSLLFKPIVIYLTLMLRGYDLKISSITALNLAQLSEFGIIIITSGVLAGLIPNEISTIAMIPLIITMVASSYMIKYDKVIFKFLEEYLKKTARFFKKKMDDVSVDLGMYNIIFFGYYNLSKELFSKLEGLGKKILVVENDPANIELLKKEGVPYIYNSIANPYFLNELNLNKAELIVSSLIDVEDNKIIIMQSKKDNPNSVIIVTAKNLKNSLELYDTGADYVIYPSYINEQQVSVLIEDYTIDINKVINKKINEIAKFKEMDKKRESLMGPFNHKFDINEFLNILKKKDNAKPQNNIVSEDIANKEK